MTDVTRLPVPNIPNARVRRKIPTPFARPSISIGASIPLAERRTWREVPVAELKTGDIIPGIGRIFEVNEKMDLGERTWTVTVRGGLNNVRVYPGNDIVWAFSAVTPVE